MLSKTQLGTMLALQNNMNVKVNPEWLTAGYGYLRAAMVESVEAIEHHGWKWWKAQEKDLPQLQMEMIDIWHFALSDYLIKHQGDADKASETILNEISLSQAGVRFDDSIYTPESLGLLENLQLMTGLSAANRFSAFLFMHICQQCDLSGDELYRQYVGKNVLNFFRQDHGYKTGEYVKIWHGEEDNEHLMKVLNALDINASNYAEQVYDGLKVRYPG
ncbi:dUTP diphosphatase [Alteromonas sediminis]|uniref:dUTP diphosphatase n=1 Tax=Alteromonas sediminis TaxID=2259342 RepID=A0A3N5YCP6_9ALTE|nr:dUTP diphosphatase [Alteromonas sediminis]RPJ67075.1 dUTP diphosphatase [Alteromonas sediminis]